MGLWDSRLFWPVDGASAVNEEHGGECFGWGLPFAEPADGYDPSAEVPDIPAIEQV